MRLKGSRAWAKKMHAGKSDKDLIGVQMWNQSKMPKL